MRKKKIPLGKQSTALSKQQLFDFLQSISPLEEKTIQKLQKILKPIRLSKKELLLKPEQVCDKVIFITKGLARAYYNKKGREVTCWFMKETDVIFSVVSFLKQTPARECIVAEEGFEGFYITYKELQYLYDNHLEFNYVGRVLTERYYLLSEDRNWMLRNCTTRERYLHMLENYGELMLRVQEAHLASYLGMSAGSLSRAKNDFLILSKKKNKK